VKPIPFGVGVERVALLVEPDGGGEIGAKFVGLAP